MDYVSFAARLSIAPQDAYVLPALFERVAPQVGLTARALLAQATYSNRPLGEYLANAARKVAAEDRKAA